MDPVKLLNVTHQIGNRTILSDMSIAFKDKKVTAIIGKSGSGKSTLLKMINGLLRPTTGVIKVFDSVIDYTNLKALRRNIGYAIQGIGLFPHLTVEENILLAGKTYLSPTQIRKERLNELLKLVNLSENLLKRYPHELSGGEQQRAGICRALFLDPSLLLMDEPFGSLDPITKFDVHQEFIRLKENAPRTVLLVTHDMREARKLADEILVLDNGTIQQFGTVKEIFEHPATDAVKELLMVAEA